MVSDAIYDTYRQKMRNAVRNGPWKRFPEFPPDAGAPRIRLGCPKRATGRAPQNLSGFASRARVYRTEFFFGRYEARARANIARALARL